MGYLDQFLAVQKMGTFDKFWAVPKKLGIWHFSLGSLGALCALFFSWWVASLLLHKSSFNLLYSILAGEVFHLRKQAKIVLKEFPQLEQIILATIFLICFLAAKNIIWFHFWIRQGVNYSPLSFRYFFRPLVFFALKGEGDRIFQ